MTLYIHFGIYKAGSSYLQYICANQRDHLAKRGIYFPHSVEDNKMEEGFISKGNADGLEKALKDENQDALEKILKKWYQQAKEKNCIAVLISAEALVHQMALKAKIDILCVIANKMGFSTLKAMGFFRDLADHALSTYKHRAKTGKHPDYIYWIKNNYETPQMLKNLSETISSSRLAMEWTLRKFQKNSDFLKKAFFKDWLDIDLPDFKARPKVNESLTLSEIKVLNQLKLSHPRVIEYFVEDLKSLSKSQKANDKALDNYINVIFATHLKQSHSILDNLNAFLPHDEHLIVNDKAMLKTDLNRFSIQLSDNQLNLLGQRILFFKGLKGRLIQMKKYIWNIIKLYRYKSMLLWL